MKNTKCLFDEEKQTPEGMVSVSQLMSFMSCPKKWEYSYMEGLAPRVDRSYLTIGKLCHKGMQVSMLNKWKDQRAGLDTSLAGGLFGSWRDAGCDAIRKEWEDYMAGIDYLAEELPEFEQILTDSLSIFSQSFEELEPWKYEVLTVYKNGKAIPALELHFVVPCAGSKGLHGYIDSILKDTNTGCVWCTDYKYRKQLSPDTEEAVNVQNAVYSRACRRMGVSITGTMTWQHLNTPASEPQVLKNGGLSRAKIKTTWKKYKEACIKAGLIPEDYEEMKDKLRDIEWFRATHEYRNDDTMDSIWNEVVVPAARAIQTARNNYRKKKRNNRSMFPWNCKMCPFMELCQAELRNYDSEYIRASSFTKKQYRDDKKVLDESSVA